MMFKLLPSKHWPIALDLGTDSIKMLQIQKSGTVLQVSACGRYRFSESVKDSEQRRRITLEAIQNMLRNGGFVGRDVISMLPMSALNVKNVRLPQMPEKELAQAVEWEARERFGYTPQKDQLNYLNAGPVRTGNEVREEVIMLSAPADVVESHLNLLKELGLRPERIDAEPIAAFRAFERFLRRREDEHTVSVLVDVGASATRVLVAKGRRIVFLKSIDIGGNKFNEAACKRLNLSPEEVNDLRTRVVREIARAKEVSRSEDDTFTDEESGAENATALSGGDTTAPADHASLEWPLRDAIRSEVESLAQEVSLCLRYCAVTFRGLRPRQVVVTGGEAYDTTILDIFHEHLGVECRAGNPLRGVDLSKVDLGGDRRGVLGEWAVCAGLSFSCRQAPDEIAEENHAND